jgi:hypothetical protein
MAQIFSRSADSWLRLGLLMLFVGFEVPNHSTLPKIDMAVFGTAICFVGCLMKCCVAAWTPVWSRAKALPWTPVSSKRMRVGSAAYG